VQEQEVNHLARLLITELCLRGSNSLPSVDRLTLNFLVLIQAADILPNLYRTVLIHPAIHSKVRAWISTKPNGGAKGRINMPPSLPAFFRPARTLLCDSCHAAVRLRVK